MNPWIIIALIAAGVVFLVDYLLRRKKWKDNSKAEKISLLVSMFAVCFYPFAAILGMFWGITGSGAKTAVGELVYKVTLGLLGVNWIVAIVATIGSFILRKKEKIKASILIHVFALSYIIIVFLVNGLSDLL